MIGMVIVSHSEKIAQGVKDLAKQMAKDVRIVAAGGLSDGSIGTDMEKIMNGINEADEGDGVVIFMDLGSAVMTAEMAVDMCEKEVTMIDGPIVEGSIASAVVIQSGGGINEIKKAVDECKTINKF
ncbi:dihydroxyacetone kinase phosphoryl donor subunit DhaM [Anaerofustis sp.]|uniref:dihydroxyacetone kinase phosphoryl donor subunit DhaM n=1 Tax=Anaerofustis sp. TaxID=1872517 RepID=UPI0025BF17B9|nr:dihydroxyacetone kinase phosphoryl donor subunit DhaM [Anaerofustis sp.]